MKQAISSSLRLRILSGNTFLVLLIFMFGGTDAQELRSLQAGFGSDTPGGRGGKILRVTTLAAEGPGSLKKALESKGPRIIVFEVAGIIDMNRQILRIKEPYVTIAGQTAPSPGITILRGGFLITTHDVILQHLAVRPGDAGQPQKSGWECDGITTSGGNAHDILIDHCSVTWSTDEGISVSGPRSVRPDQTSHRVTIRNCIIAESLHNSSHGKGKHSMGSLIHDGCTEVAIIGNLYAHNNQRNPYFKAFATGVIVNNVIYNPGSNGIQLGFSKNEWKDSGVEPQPPRVSIVGNVYQPGVSTKPKLPMVTREGLVFLEDNQTTAPLTDKYVELLKEKPVWPQELKPLPAAKVLEYIASHAGTRPRERNPIDQRIIRDLQTGKGQIIHSQEEVGGYPEIPTITQKLEIPEGRIEEWLKERAKAVE